MNRSLPAPRWIWLLAPAAAVGCVLAGLQLPGAGGSTLRACGGLPLVLALPGRAVSGLFRAPARSRKYRPGHGKRASAAALERSAGDGGSAEPDAVAGMERVLACVALSLTAAILGAFLLNFLPGGLVARNWLILEGAVATAAELGVLAGTVGRRQPLRWPAWLRQAPRLVPVLAATGAVVVAAGALGLAHVSAASVPKQNFTQLWLVPSQHTGNLSSVHRAHLGVGDHETGSTTYRLVLRHRGSQTKSWYFTLTRGQRWSRTVQLPADRQLSADLYRGTDKSSYRHVELHRQNFAAKGSS
jgi:hypothetical protein